MQISGAIFNVAFKDSRFNVALCNENVQPMISIEVSLSVHVKEFTISLLENIWKPIAKVGVGKRKLLSVNFLSQLLTASFQIRNMLGCLR